MNKRLIVILITILSTQISAQQSISPYSFYGIGSLKLRGTVENRSMGGISVYMDSIHMNLRNPASYVSKNLDAKGFDGESRPVKYAIAGSYTSVSLENATTSTSTDRGTFDYFAFNFPIGNFGVALGTMPYSSVGYRLQDIDNNDLLRNLYEGEGGLNRVFAGLAYKITDGLSIGVDMNYNFGNIQNSAITIDYTDNVPLQFQSQERNRSDLSGLNYNFGVSYKTMISKKLELMSSLAYSPESNISSNNERNLFVGTYSLLTNRFVPLTTIEVDLAERGLENTDLVLPSRFSVGVGVGQPRHWFVGAEYTALSSSQFDNPIFDIDISEFENSTQLSFGGFFIPRYNAFRGYFKRVVYRAGFRTENTGLVINDEAIREFGISFGAGLPLGRAYSDINIGLEWGQRGTTNKNLIQENFFSFNISLSLNDRWFKRRKFE
ncbi:MAG: hypothetical protein AAGH46_10050 [Bacteroidota bacterium]